MKKCFFALYLNAFLSLFGAAAVPGAVNYQGQLLNAQGRPLESTAGRISITVRMFDALNDGDLVWGPKVFPSVNLVGGTFNLILEGPDENQRPLAQAFDGVGDRYLEIQVDGANPVQPRQRILASPYSLRSRTAEFAENTSSITIQKLAQEVIESLSPVGMIAPFAGPSEKIPNGWLVCDGSALSSIDYPQLFMTIGSHWGDGREAPSGAASQAIAGGPERTDFNLPDLRGMFLRGVNGDRSDNYSDIDGSQRQLGSLQDDMFQRHRHFMFSWKSGVEVIDRNLSGTVGSNRFAVQEKGTSAQSDYQILGIGEEPTAGLTSLPHRLIGNEARPLHEVFGDESRPVNAAVNFMVKY